MPEMPRGEFRMLADGEDAEARLMDLLQAEYEARGKDHLPRAFCAHPYTVRCLLRYYDYSRPPGRWLYDRAKRTLIDTGMFPTVEAVTDFDVPMGEIVLIHDQGTRATA